MIVIGREQSGHFSAWIRKGVHWHVWIYRQDTLDDALREVGTTAASGEITWDDAAALVRGMRQMVRQGTSQG